MLLDYGTLISPSPISLSIGNIKKPTLHDISEITFERFNEYEVFLKLTPKTFYEKIEKELAKSEWDALNEDERSKITLFDIILMYDRLKEIYVEIFNFFFVEPVVFKDGFFVMLKNNALKESLTEENIRGVIHKGIFDEVLTILQQLCCIYDKKSNIKDLTFKNNIAKKLYQKILGAQKKEAEERKADKNLTIPNIISAVCAKHPSLSYSNIWNITLYQLIDTFNRLQVNFVHDIDSTRVAVWGDKKKQFKEDFWYRNQYDT